MVQRFGLEITQELERVVVSYEVKRDDDGHQVWFLTTLKEVNGVVYFVLKSQISFIAGIYDPELKKIAQIREKSDPVFYGNPDEVVCIEFLPCGYGVSVRGKFFLIPYAPIR